MDKNYHNIGEKVKVTITSTTGYGAFAKLDNGEIGLIHISEISNAYIADIANVLPVNSVVDVLIIADGNKPHTYKLSLKRISRRTRQRTLMNKPLTRKQFNKEKIDSISFEEVKNALPQQIDKEYTRLTGGQQ